MRFILLLVFTLSFSTPQMVEAKYSGLGAVIHAVGQAGKAIGQAGEWVWDKALKPAGTWVGKEAFGIGSGGTKGFALLGKNIGNVASTAGTWIWEDAFGVGSGGTKGIAKAGAWVGSDVLGVNSHGTKGFALLGKNIGNVASSAWNWTTKDVKESVQTFGQ